MGGVIAFTGGLIGPEVNPKKYHGDFKEQKYLSVTKMRSSCPIGKVGRIPGDVRKAWSKRHAKSRRSKYSHNQR